MSLTLLKKISALAVAGNIKNLALDTFYIKRDLEQLNPDAPLAIHLYTVYGVVGGIKTGATDNGDWMSFEGDFKAIQVNLETGEQRTFRAPRLFIHEPAQSLIESALSNDDAVEIAYEITLVAAKNQFGYEYRASPLIEPQQSDVLNSLEKQLQEKYGNSRLALASQENAVKMLGIEKGADEVIEESAEKETAPSLKETIDTKVKAKVRTKAKV